MYRNWNLTLVLAFAAGLVGGFFSRYITLPLHAQAQPSNAVEIRAQRFSVVDAQGRVIGTFTSTNGADPQGGNRFRPRITLVDPNGRELWSAGGGFKPLAENSK